jgi:hypothetical protein
VGFRKSLDRTPVDREMALMKHVVLGVSVNSASLCHGFALVAIGGPLAASSSPEAGISHSLEGSSQSNPGKGHKGFGSRFLSGLNRLPPQHHWPAHPGFYPNLIQCLPPISILEGMLVAFYRLRRNCRSNADFLPFLGFCPSFGSWALDIETEEPGPGCIS